MQQAIIDTENMQSENDWGQKKRRNNDAWTDLVQKSYA